MNLFEKVVESSRHLPRLRVGFHTSRSNDEGSTRFQRWDLVMSKSVVTRWFVRGTLLVVGLLAVGWFSGLLTWWMHQQALTAYSHRDYSVAWDWTQRSLRLAGDHPETEFLISRIERKRGHLDLAGKHLYRSATLGVERDRIRREELLIRAQQGDIAGSIKDLYQMLSRYSEDGAEICDATVNGLLINGQIAEADSLIEQWIQAFPADPQPDYLRGRIAEFHRNLPKTEDSYRKALAKNPKYFAAAFGLGRVLVERNRWEEALKAYKTCLAFSDQAPARIGMARCLENLGKEEDAFQLLSQVAKQPRYELNDSLIQLGEQTEFDVFSFEFGTLESKRGNNNDAIKWLQRAVDYNPRHREARYQLARSLKSVGQAGEAKRHFDWYQATQEKTEEINRLLDQVKLDPENQALRCRLGMLYQEIGSEKAGEFWLRSVLVDGPNSPDSEAVNQAQQALKQTRQSPRPPDTQ